MGDAPEVGLPRHPRNQPKTGCWGDQRRSGSGAAQTSTESAQDRMLGGPKTLRKWGCPDIHGISPRQDVGWTKDAPEVGLPRHPRNQPKTGCWVDQRRSGSGVAQTSTESAQNRMVGGAKTLRKWGCPDIHGISPRQDTGWSQDAPGVGLPRHPRNQLKTGWWVDQRRSGGG